MQTVKNIICVGNGGHSRVCQDVLAMLDWRVVDFVTYPLEKVYVGHSYLVAFGSLNQMELRWAAYGQIISGGGKLPAIISPLAYVAPGVEIGDGTIVMHRATILPIVQIGRNCIINTSSIIEHDSVIGDNVHVSTGAMVNGNCFIGSNCLIGSNSTILQEITIGDDVIIGAGAVVNKSIEWKGTYVGVPARQISVSCPSSC